MAPNTHFEIDETSFRRWRSIVGAELGTVISFTRPTLRSLVGLALCERLEKPSSYDELKRVIQSRVARNEKEKDNWNSSVSKESLRVAVASIAATLRSSGHPLQLVSKKAGREVTLTLQRISLGGGQEALAPITSPFKFFKGGDLNSIIDPKTICHSLLRDGGGLPFANAYSSYRAAAKWLSFSSGYASKKRTYEGESFDAYGLVDKLKLKTCRKLAVVGLACGEGLGEVELLERVLAVAVRFGIQVEYLAVDTSEFMLLSHSRLIEERFSKKITSQILVPVYVVGDLYKLDRHLLEARNQMSESFLKDCPVLCLFYGNCLGNYEYHEWDYFRSLMEAFPKSHPLATLVGVSLLRKNEKGAPISEKYTLDQFFLETPRHLMYELKLLTSRDSAGKVIPLSKGEEFILNTEETQKHIPISMYETNLGIKGAAYRFYYKLKNNIETWDGEQRMMKGSNIHLYTTIKYDLPSLVSALTNRGWKIESPPGRYEVQEIISGDEVFHYGIFLAMR